MYIFTYVYLYKPLQEHQRGYLQITRLTVLVSDLLMCNLWEELDVKQHSTLQLNCPLPVCRPPPCSSVVIFLSWLLSLVCASVSFLSWPFTATSWPLTFSWMPIMSDVAVATFTYKRKIGKVNKRLLSLVLWSSYTFFILVTITILITAHWVYKTVIVLRRQ